MSAHTTRPLADAYLRDLERLLHGLDPGDREEVLAGVREHLDGRLGTQPSAEAERAALTGLGPPQAIADEAYAGRPMAPAPPASAATPTWQAVTATAVNALGLALLAVLTLGTAHPSELFFVGWLLALPWLLVVVMSILSPVWDRREKLVSIALIPVVLTCLAAFLLVLVVTVGPNPVNLVVPLVVLGLAVWAVVRLLAKALR